MHVSCLNPLYLWSLIKKTNSTVWVSSKVWSGADVWTPGGNNQEQSWRVGRVMTFTLSGVYTFTDNHCEVRGMCERVKCVKSNFLKTSRPENVWSLCERVWRSVSASCDLSDQTSALCTLSLSLSLSEWVSDLERNVACCCNEYLWLNEEEEEEERRESPCFPALFVCVWLKLCSQ